MVVTPVRAARFLVFVILAMAAAPLAQAQTGAAPTSRSAQIEQARGEFQAIRSEIEAGDLDDYGDIETRLRVLRDASRTRLSSIERELESVSARLAALGAAPGEGDPPESADLAEERKQITTELARLNSQKTRVNANIIEANDLLRQIAASRIGTFYGGLAERGASPLSPGVWRRASLSGVETADRIGAYFRNWSKTRVAAGALSSSLAMIALALCVAVIIFGPVSRWVMRTFSAAIERREPSPPRRVLVAGLKMLARAAPGLIGGFVVIETLRAQGVLTDAGEAPVRAMWFALVMYLLISGFLKGLFAPANPKWRIAPVDARRAKTISAIINAIVIIFGLKIFFVAILTASGAAPELIRLLTAIAAILVAGLLFLLCRTRLWRGAGALGLAQTDPAPAELGASHETPPQRWRIARRIGRALAIIIAVGAVAGYVEFADFAASRLYFLSIIIAFAWFVRAILMSMAEIAWRRRDLEETETDGDAAQRFANLKFWNGWIVNALLAVAVAPAVLILVGVKPSAVRDGLQQALFGFNIGGVQVPSIAKLFLAAAIFFVIMMLTRIAQRGFRAGPFAHSNIDPGVQNSLITLIGYAGLIVALFASISAVGFDLSNLALIAGALSVGIGFGLQSIVNNFVSGLILLFERPIKVGDWIVTTSGEGTVKKISVRSTEIETFDRSSIIVPNSELISSTVTNWTHKNKLGRIIVPIGVAYGSDAEKVMDILLRCARDHPMIVNFPEPFVTWQGFGDSSLDFDLRGFLRDISMGLKVRTELRLAIYKSLAEEGIEIPFPQRDVHVKSWPDRTAGETLEEGGAGNDRPVQTRD